MRPESRTIETSPLKVSEEVKKNFDMRLQHSKDFVTKTFNNYDNQVS